MYYDTEVFYDADCPFCCRCIEWACGKDKRARLTFTDLNAPASMLEVLGLTNKEIGSDVHVVTGEGDVLSGAWAVRHILWVLGYRKTAWLLSLPLVSWGWDRLYKLVKANRHRL